MLPLLKPQLRYVLAVGRTVRERNVEGARSAEKHSHLRDRRSLRERLARAAISRTFTRTNILAARSGVRFRDTEIPTAEVWSGSVAGDDVSAACRLPPHSFAGDCGARPAF